MVDDLDDGCQSASVRVVAVDGNNAADLDEAPVGSLNHCFAHCDRVLIYICQSLKSMLVVCCLFQYFGCEARECSYQ